MSRMLECGCSSGAPGDACRERGEWHIERYTVDGEDAHGTASGDWWVETLPWPPNLAKRVEALEAVLDGYGARDMESLSRKLKAAEAQVEAARAVCERLRLDASHVSAVDIAREVAAISVLAAMDEAKHKYK